MGQSDRREVKMRDIHIFILGPQPLDKIQAEAKLEKIDPHQKMNIYHVEIVQTVDEYILSLLEEKRNEFR